MVANLVGFLGDFDLAEEAAQEAFATAAERWPRDGVPRNPAAWLTATARNRAIDRLRRERTLAEKTHALEVAPSTDAEVEPDPRIPDERLELLFACCHPALATDAQVALTLRALGGLTTDEIARAFLVAPETMKRRLTRAKSKVRDAGLATEAIRLARVVVDLMPDEPEAHGLLALMLIHDARRAARFAGGELVLLQEQDRSRWDQEQIAAARTALDRAVALRGRGPYVLQAAIASLQADDEIDWPQVAALYGELVRLTGSPVVELNRVVAVAEVHGAAAALVAVDVIDGLDDYPYLHSTRAELLRRLGRTAEAQAAYARALELVAGAAERRFLERRLGELAD